MREYRRAESGNSNGILMNERKTKKNVKTLKEIKKKHYYRFGNDPCWWYHR